MLKCEKIGRNLDFSKTKVFCESLEIYNHGSRPATVLESLRKLTLLTYTVSLLLLLEHLDVF